MGHLLTAPPWIWVLGAGFGGSPSGGGIGLGVEPPPPRPRPSPQQCVWMERKGLWWAQGLRRWLRDQKPRPGLYPAPALTPQAERGLHPEARPLRVPGP